MDLRELRYFAAVVEAGSISTAATRLHMTQPPLSLAISKLERELGVRLLTRSSRGVHPTPAGRYLIDAGSMLLNESARIEQTLRHMGDGRAGELRLAVGPILTWEFLPPLLARYAIEAPDVDIELFDPPSGQILERVRRAEVDVGIVATADIRALRAAVADEMNVSYAGQLPIVLALPPGYTGTADPVELADFESEIWLVPHLVERFPGIEALVGDAWRIAGISPTRIRHLATPQTALPLIAAGLGIGVVPDAARAARSDIVVRRTTPSIGALEITVLWRRHTNATEAMLRFLSVLDCLPDGSAAS
ncbi:LysR family transcriptional regulator [Microbacterium kribbense]|uniref:LysR family transcriptional regulator n=1 Tax=Microbacterium kribbense TaxID=433645 RepID=A0ABP7GP11_9MICO